MSDVKDPELAQTSPAVDANKTVENIDITNRDSVSELGGTALETQTPKVGTVTQDKFDTEINRITKWAGNVKFEKADYQQTLTYVYYVGSAGLITSSLVALALDYNKMFDKVVYALTFVSIFLFISLWAFLARTNITSPERRINIKYIGDYLPMYLNRRGFLAFLAFILAGSFSLYLLYLAAWYNYVIDDHLTVQSTEKMAYRDAGVRQFGIKATFFFEEEVEEYGAKYEIDDPFVKNITTAGHCYKRVDKNAEGKYAKVKCDAPEHQWDAVKFDRKHYITYDYFVDIDFGNSDQFNCGMVQAGKDQVSKCNSLSVTVDIYNDFFDKIKTSFDTILFQIAPLNDQTIVWEDIDEKEYNAYQDNKTPFDEIDDWCQHKKDERCNKQCDSGSDNGGSTDNTDSGDNNNASFDYCYSHNDCKEGEFCFEGECDVCAECHYCHDGIDYTCGKYCPNGPTKEETDCYWEYDVERPKGQSSTSSTTSTTGTYNPKRRRVFTPDHAQAAVYLSARDRSKDIKLRGHWIKKVHINGGEDTILGFDMISDLETSGTTQIDRCDQDDPKGNIPTEVKFTFEFITDDKFRFDVHTYTETLSYTLNDIWTGIMASSNAILAAFAFFFANTLPSRYFAWSSLEKEGTDIEAGGRKRSVEMSKRVTE